MKRAASIPVVLVVCMTISTCYIPTASIPSTATLVLSVSKALSDSWDASFHITYVVTNTGDSDATYDPSIHPARLSIYGSAWGRLDYSITAQNPWPSAFRAGESYEMTLFGTSSPFVAHHYRIKIIYDSPDETAKIAVAAGSFTVF